MTKEHDLFLAYAEVTKAPAACTGMPEGYHRRFENSVTAAADRYSMVSDQVAYWFRCHSCRIDGGCRSKSSRRTFTSGQLSSSPASSIPHSYAAARVELANGANASSCCDVDGVRLGSLGFGFGRQKSHVRRYSHADSV